MVTYCLGISRVCPLRWGLYFERFLNDQRGDCPDIDIDICGARRDELLDYVYQRWGAEHVAMIASFITMHARLAVREVAKVFGVSPGDVDRFTKRLPHRPVREILQDRKSTRLNSSHSQISYAVFCLKKKNNTMLLHPLLTFTHSTIT